LAKSSKWCYVRKRTLIRGHCPTLMTLAEQIEAVLLAHPGQPLSVAELSARLPGRLRPHIEAACVELREQGRLGRNGADTHAKPFRFYLKDDVRADLSGE